MEQLFSFMSRFNVTTKNMSAAGREEQLTCAALFWNHRKIKGLGGVLLLRLKKTRKQISELATQLQEVTHSTSLDAAKDLARKCKDKVQQCARDELVDDSFQNLADLAEYFRLKKYVQDSEKVQMYLTSTSETLSIITGFHELFVAARKVVLELPRKKARLTSLEHKVTQLDIVDLDRESLCSAAKATLCKLQEQVEMGYLQMQKKHAAIQTKATSSKQRSSLRRAIADDKKKLTKYIHQYNSVAHDVELDIPPLQEKDIFEGKFPWSPLSSKLICVYVYES
jgi:hypothetical protein